MSTRRQARGTAARDALTGTGSVDVLTALADPGAVIWSRPEDVAAICAAADLTPDMSRADAAAARPGLWCPCFARFRAVRAAFAASRHLVDSTGRANLPRLRELGVYTADRSPTACPWCDRGHPRT